MTAPARFRSADITRAMKGARAAGFTHVRVGIDVQGNIVIDGTDASTGQDLTPPNPLDRVFDTP